MLGQRIDAQQEPPHEGLVHDGDGQASCAVTLGEGAAMGEADPERLEVRGADDAPERPGLVGGVVGGPADDLESHEPHRRSVHWHGRGDRRGEHAGDGLNAVEELPVERVDPFRSFEAPLGDGQEGRRTDVFSP